MRVFLICLLVVIGIAMPLSCATLGISSTASSGGSGGASSTSQSASASTGAFSCDLCAKPLGGIVTQNLCPTSSLLFDEVAQCACSTTCAPVCASQGDGGSICHAFDGTAPLACKACMSSAAGCGARLSACQHDDGMTAPAVTDAGPPCSCPASMPLCPASWSCASPGAAPARVCGQGNYCKACCDSANTCAIRGTCQLTEVAGAPCSMPEACCSGVCSRGACVGGCGVLLPGSGATGSGG